MFFSGLRYINNFFAIHGDPRVANWPFMSTPLYTIIICIIYVYGVKVLGPKLMEKRKPIHLKNTLLAYNFFQIVLSTYLFYELGMAGWFTGEYSFRCQPVDYSSRPSALRTLYASHLYLMAKFTELLDTVFFVMRKKFDQVSTLHVFHHSIMPLSTWCGVKLVAGGHSTLFGFLNSFVHIVMYGYYFPSALKIDYQKYLWWKKYLTTLQMLQFIVIIVHSFQLLFIDCNFPQSFVWAIGMHGVVFYFLFNKFYLIAYTKPKKVN